MRLYDYKDQWVLALTAFCLILFTFSGCAKVGPRSISMGRAEYNEAINRTEDEQLLMSIIKGRYGETYSLLAVSGVAANIRFRTSAGIEAGFGPSDNYAGRLVPLRGGLAYEENPTITYAPVQGERYIRQLMSPIPLDILILAVRSRTSGRRVLTVLVNRINNLRNPDFLEEPSLSPDQRFVRFVDLTMKLRKVGVVDLVRDPRKEVAFNIVITGYASRYSKLVVEYLDLLDLQIPAGESEEIVIPAYFGMNTKKAWGIGIITRSTFDLIEIFRAAIEVPQEHALEGLTIKYPPMGLPGQGIRVISSKERPKKIQWAVKYLGYWFYIDKSDQHTKEFYRALRNFWSISIAGTAADSPAPVLTLPVSR